jgi:hypothetical protein
MYVCTHVENSLHSTPFFIAYYSGTCMVHTHVYYVSLAKLKHAMPSPARKCIFVFTTWNIHISIYSRHIGLLFVLQLNAMICMHVEYEIWSRTESHSTTLGRGWTWRHIIESFGKSHSSCHLHVFNEIQCPPFIA